MKPTWTKVVIGFLLVLAGQVVAVQFGWYDGSGVWFDLLLHFASGALLAMVWLVLVKESFQIDSWLAFSLAAGGFALLGSFVWELFELLLNTQANDVATTYDLQSLTLQDALTDMLAGLCGGLFWGWFSYKNSKEDSE